MFTFLLQRTKVHFRPSTHFMAMTHCVIYQQTFLLSCFEHVRYRSTSFLSLFVLFDRSTEKKGCKKRIQEREERETEEREKRREEREKRRESKKSERRERGGTHVCMFKNEVGKNIIFFSFFFRTLLAIILLHVMYIYTVPIPSSQSSYSN